MFLGLLAGRELGLTLTLNHRPVKETWILMAKDGGKAGIGLIVSVALALSLPALRTWAFPA